MLKLALRYTFTVPGGDRHLDDALFALLRAIDDTGSIGAAARALDRSYRHVWGELRRWETALGGELVGWQRGQAARLSPFAHRLLWAEARVRARIEPQLQGIGAQLESALAAAFDERVLVLPVRASHDLALPLLGDALAAAGVHLDLRYEGSIGALAALNAGRAALAGFHVGDAIPPGSAAVRRFRRLLIGRGLSLIEFVRRRQGLIVRAGNPHALARIGDLARPGLRFVNRQAGSGTRIEFDQLLADAGVAATDISGYDGEETTHLAVAAAVASGAADAGFGIEAAAARFGLDFVALSGERYFLACPTAAVESAPILALRDALRSPQLRMRIAALPGYALAEPGAVLPAEEALARPQGRKVR